MRIRGASVSALAGCAVLTADRPVSDDCRQALIQSFMCAVSFEISLLEPTMNQTFFNDRQAIESHLLDIEAALTRPIESKPARLRDRIITKAVVFLADQIGKRSIELHNELRLRIEMLEQRGPALSLWADGSRYSKGAFVLHGGNLWCANENTIQEPSRESRDWSLSLGGF